MTYTNNHAAATTSMTNVLTGLAALQNIPSTVTNYFRIVNWNATGTAGTWYVNNATPATMPDFQVDGAATPVAPAQNLATWWPNSLTGGGGTPPAPFANNTAANNVIVTPLMKGVGITNITTASVYGGSGWTNAGIADSESSSITNALYLTYAIQAAAGCTVSFYTNVLFFHNSATGPHSGELQYSTDGTNYVDLESLTYGPAATANTLVVTNDLDLLCFLCGTCPRR